MTDAADRDCGAAESLSSRPAISRNAGKYCARGVGDPRSWPQNQSDHAMQYIAWCMPMPSEAMPISRRSARLEVFERLRTWIEEGQLAPGEILKDSELGAALGVSRTPVREALQMLEHNGLVEMQPGRLTRVSEAPFADVERVYAPLSALQALAAELGTPHAGAADIDEMRSCNDRLLAALESDDALAAREADRDFHGVLVRLADNPYLAAAIDPMLAHIRRLEALYFHDLKRGSESRRDHEAIIAAVETGDSATAREATRRNFHRHWTPTLPR